MIFARYGHNLAYGLTKYSSSAGLSPLADARINVGCDPVTILPSEQIEISVSLSLLCQTIQNSAMGPQIGSWKVEMNG